MFDWQRLSFDCDDFGCPVVEQDGISQLKVIGGGPDPDNHWRIWWYEPEGGGSDGYWYRPEGDEKESLREPDKVKPGFIKSQKIWQNRATWRGGLMRRFLIRPHQSIRFEIAVKLLTPLEVGGQGSVKIGIDPTGGTDPFNADILWSAWDGHPHYDTWLELIAQGQAGPDGKVTVFTWAEWKYRALWCDTFWCDARVYVAAEEDVPPVESRFQPRLILGKDDRIISYRLPAPIAELTVSSEQLLALKLGDGTITYVNSTVLIAAGQFDESNDGINLYPTPLSDFLIE